jgi:hypothetical protein
MRSAVLLAACIIGSTIALGQFQPAQAQQEFQAPQGQARQRLLRRALGISESSAITQIAELTPSQPIVNAGTPRMAALSALHAEHWSPLGGPQGNSHTGYVRVGRGAAELSGSPQVTMTFPMSPGIRHLVICDIRRNGAFEVEVTDVSGLPRGRFTWESATRGALLLPPVNNAVVAMLRFRVPPDAPEGSSLDLSGCTISAISA